MATQSSDAPPIQAVGPDGPVANAVADTAHSTATSAEHGEGGLPQLEMQWWPGQIFWLLIIFAILYGLMAFVFLPRLRRVKDERAETIASAVESARQVQTEAAGQAEIAKGEVVQARAAARATAAAAKARVAAEAQTRAAAEEAAVNARIAEAEDAIRATRDAALSNVSSIAADTARAMIERLTGQTPSAAEARVADGAA